MPYDESLVVRVRDQLTRTQGIVEKKLFGGICFMLNGNMLVGVWKHWLIARLGIEESEAALGESNVREFDVTGKPMRGWVMIEPDALEEDESLQDWIERASRFVRTLPGKG